MSHHPPHLPPQASSLRGHYIRQSVLWLSVLIILAGLAGVTGSLVTIAWVTPDLSQTDGSSIFFNGRRSADSATPSTALVTHVYQRMVRVYDTTKLVHQTVYPKNALVGQALMVSSDGWGVAVFSEGQNANIAKHWTGIDATGAEYPVETVFTDPVSGITYIKFRGNGFRVISFADDATLGWSTYARNWHMVDIHTATLGDGAAVPVTTMVFGTLSPEVSVGSFVMSDEGMLLGIAGKNSAYLPSWLIRLELGHVLQSGTVEYTAVPWIGRWVDGMIMNGRFEHVNGWYVEKGAASTSTVTVANGDIVMAINGRTVLPETIMRQIFEAPQSFSVTVWRGGQEIDLPVEKHVFVPPAK